KYVVAQTKDTPNYDDKYMTFFPRMFSSQGNHIDAYISWAGLDEKKLYYESVKHQKPKNPPGFIANLKFFFKYQLGHMYFRYFMWNFSGRQNNIEGHGSPLHGNWITGIPFIDKAMIGSQDSLPKKFKNNMARNKYYLLPLLFGIIGLIYQYQRDVKNFTVVLLLFFFTGIAIVIYLNQTPYQPRERDYAYSGSFYAFAIWLGLGMFALYDAVKNLSWKNYSITGGIIAGIAIVLLLFGSISGAGNIIGIVIFCFSIVFFVLFGFMKLVGFVPVKIVHVVIAFLLALPVPVMMAMENWDDHNRSDRFMARDFARNYLESCAPNSVLITYGDNDTFPLWYAQEVEGIRTDVRVLCFTLFNTDWYVDQMARKAYESDALPFSMKHDQYVQGTRDLVYVMDHTNFKGPVDLKEAMEFVASDLPAAKLPNAENINFLPSKTIRWKIDSAKVLATGTIKPEDAGKIVPYIDLTVKSSFLQKNELMLLDFLEQNNWERPVYFTSIGDMEVSFKEYLQLEGFAYRLIPVKTPCSVIELGRIETTLLYDNLMNKFKWGNLNKPGIYIDQTILHTINIVRLRSNFIRLAEVLIKEGKNDSAKAVLDRCEEIMPQENVQYDFTSFGLAECYYNLDETEKANNVISILYEDYIQELDYYLSFAPEFQDAIDYEKRVALQIVRDVANLARQYKQTDLYDKFNKKFESYYKQVIDYKQ
ncbi:MAG: hypothetical protein HY738_24470, partial [Bacteroidia bacterium]|nr:hypothetical protein [Bacteroidia bacterium]